MKKFKLQFYFSLMSVRVLSLAEELNILLLGMETHKRGYLLTQDISFENEYQNNQNQIWLQFRYLNEKMPEIESSQILISKMMSTLGVKVDIASAGKEGF